MCVWTVSSRGRSGAGGAGWEERGGGRECVALAAHVEEREGQVRTNEES